MFPKTRGGNAAGFFLPASGAADGAGRLRLCPMRGIAAVHRREKFAHFSRKRVCATRNPMPAMRYSCIGGGRRAGAARDARHRPRVQRACHGRIAAGRANTRVQAIARASVRIASSRCAHALATHPGHRLYVPNAWRGKTSRKIVDT
ncbi:MAG TPA: hypothetical protein VGE33_03535 [Thermomonas sp.]